jgi:molybdopterin molybdotransferase
LAEPLSKKPGRTFFVRVRLFKEKGQLYAVSAGDQNTGILKTLIDANAVAILPTEKGNLAAGDEVQVYLMDER